MLFRSQALLLRKPSRCALGQGDKREETALRKKILRSAVSYYIVRGEIRNNIANIDGGGISLGFGANAFAFGGVIAENTAKERGGGMVNYNGVCKINGAVIKANRAGIDGGGIYAVNASFSFTNGKITDNAANWGGGVYLNESAFIFTGGEIVGNAANTNGGGVYVYTNSSFEMTGGKILNNTANSSGGGVIVNNNCSFKMTGGEISFNTANGNGGGAYVY